jgi:hypothetical protein
MSTANSLCWHEPTAHIQSYDALVEFWKPKFGEIVGISDSALTLQLDRILSEIRPRTLLIERPIPQVMASMRKYFKGAELMLDYDEGRRYLGRLAEKIDQFRTCDLVRTVAFEALKDYDTVLDLITWLAPGIDLLDLRTLMHFNIQADRDHVIDLIKRPHTHWYREPCEAL